MPDQPRPKPLPVRARAGRAVRATGTSGPSARRPGEDGRRRRPRQPGRPGRRGGARRRSGWPPTLALPAAATEAEVLAELRALAGRNRRMVQMIGLGYYDTFTPPVVLRNVLENPAWYTAYTPYQPEISQGRLEALLNFQTMVARPDRAADRERQPARRGDRRRRGDDPAAPASRHGRASVFVRRRRHASADGRRAADARRAARHRAARRTTSTRARCRTSRSSACCCPYPGTSGAVRDHAALVERRRTSAGRWSPSPPTCWR